MSYTVSAAVAAAVRASISTPVRPSQLTVAEISTQSFSRFRESFKSMPSITMGWHMGIRSGVCFAPMTPATWATVSTSPFFMPPLWIREKVFSFTNTRAMAVAVRRVMLFSPTSTILARPWSLKWVKSDIFFSLRSGSCCARRSCVSGRKAPRGRRALPEWQRASAPASPGSPGP